MIEWRKQPEMKAYMEQIIPGRSEQEIREAFYDQFHITLTKAQIKGFKNLYHVRSGTVGGRFEKGQPSHNKGQKMSPEQYAKAKATMFKPGNIPANHRPVGSERVNVDGYVEIKIAEPNKWRLKQREVWEQHYGEKLTSNDAIIFLDGNKLNLKVSNLVKVSRAELARYNQEKLRCESTEINMAAINMARLKTKLYKIIQEGKDEKHNNQ